jgi:hypothetical protein
MNDRPNPTTRSRGATWVGLFIALFGILIVRAAVYAFYPALLLSRRGLERIIELGMRHRTPAHYSLW